MGRSAVNGLTHRYRSLDVRWLQREGYLLGGPHAFSLSWRDGQGRQLGWVDVREGHEDITLSYRVREDQGEWRDITERVALTYTACNFGGARPWFICPQCGCRVAKLYLAGERFLCRKCSGLSYRSQRDSDLDRLLSKAQGIRERLGGSASLIAPFPARPRYMHWKTYRRLRDEAMDAEVMMYGTLHDWLGKMEGVSGTRQP